MVYVARMCLGFAVSSFLACFITVPVKYSWLPTTDIRLRCFRAVKSIEFFAAVVLPCASSVDVTAYCNPLYGRLYPIIMRIGELGGWREGTLASC